MKLPPHRPYHEGPALVDLLGPVGIHKADRYYTKSVNSEGRTTLFYEKNDKDNPGRKFVVDSDNIRLGEYGFDSGKFSVTVWDDTGRPWRGDIRFRVVSWGRAVDAEIRRGSDGQWAEPTINWSSLGSCSLDVALEYIQTIKFACDLVEAEAAYQKSLEKA